MKAGPWPVGAGQLQGQPVLDAGGRLQSNMRFRSFCERYFVTRSAFFRQDPQGLTEDTWACILDAKRAYKLMGQVALHVDD